MGDPRRIRKKYQKPRHPWRADMLEEEKKILKTYGLKNKKEIWRAETLTKSFRRHARKLFAFKTEQAKKEEKLLLDRLKRLNLLKGDATLDNVLTLKTEDVLGRRLQTMVFKKGFATTINQARQLIVHGHVSVKGEKVTAPSYLVTADEEDAIQVAQKGE